MEEEEGEKNEETGERDFFVCVFSREKKQKKKGEQKTKTTDAGEKRRKKGKEEILSLLRHFVCTHTQIHRAFVG